MENDEESIFCSLSALLEENPTISEYDFIVTEAKSSPFLLIEDRLGIEAKVAKSLALWLNGKFSFCLRSFKKLDNEKDVETLSKCLLLFISDNATAWNLRKEYALKDKLDLCNELKFNALVLSKNPKSSEVFFHRKWLLQKMVANLNSCQSSPEHTNTSCERCRLLAEELKVCGKASSRHTNNQPAWNHRLWSISNFACCQMRTVEDELKTSKTFLSLNLSDNSAFNYRRNLLSTFLEASNDYGKFVGVLSDEFHFVKDLIDFYEGFESLWYHRRFVWNIILELCRRKSCLTTVRDRLSKLAAEIQPNRVDRSNKKSRSTHGHLDHSHYHHSLHPHYAHHHHRHLDRPSTDDDDDSSTVEPVSPDGDRHSRLPEAVDPEVLKVLDDAVVEEIMTFKKLKAKFQGRYVEVAKSSWFEVVARRYVSWFGRGLKPFAPI